MDRNGYSFPYEIGPLGWQLDRRVSTRQAPICIGLFISASRQFRTIGGVRSADRPAAGSIPATQLALFVKVRDETAETPCEVRDAKNNEAYGAMSKERHVCARRRVGEPAVSL